MNVITSSHAISLYPKLTFVDNVNISRNLNDADNWLNLLKYSGRGLPFESSFDQQLAHRCEARRIRILGDRYCWVIRHTDGVDKFLYQESWSMNQFPDGMGFRMEFDRFKEKYAPFYRCLDPPNGEHIA